MILIISNGEGQEIQLDKSKSVEFKCNDHLDRLWLHFSFENKSAIFDNYGDIVLHYTYQPCFETNNCAQKHLTTINSNTSILKLIINSAYSYQIEISSQQKTNNISNSKVCENTDFYQFIECGQYSLNIVSNASCTISFISNEMEFSIVKYVYLFFGLSLSLVVMAKLIKATFFRYQLIK